MRLVFVRHAQSEANAEGRWQGRAEYGLSDEGRAQAERLYQRFQEEAFQPTHVYSSPQRRAAETAQIVARSWPVPVLHWDDLREHDVGIFSGLTWEEIADRYPDVAQEFSESRRWDIVEGAERVEERRARGRRVIETTLREHTNDDVVLIFAHGGILLHVLAALMGTYRTWGASIGNTAVFEFTVDVERWSLDGDALHNTALWRINRFNDASHLSRAD